MGLWADFGLPLAPFGSLWGALGLPLAVLWGPFGEPLGHIGNFIENWTSFTEKCIKFIKQLTKTRFLEFASGATGATGARQTLPSTHAGGQDDGS